ncbi:hypothetical protein QGP82_02805 [Leptothoe sp. LEGE 181152]|nr:hypothetical protein [Leptothoe sp. LEGE 181152]
MAMAVSIGPLIGEIAGFYGGLIGAILMRFTDLFLSLPQLPLSLLVIYLFGDAVACPGTPEWHHSAPHMAIFPGAATFLTVLSLNFIGDGLRDKRDAN